MSELQSDLGSNELLEQFTITEPTVECASGNRVSRICVTKTCNATALHCHSDGCQSCSSKHLNCMTVNLQSFTKKVQQQAEHQKDFFLKMLEVENKTIESIKQQRKIFAASLFFGDVQQQEREIINDLFKGDRKMSGREVASLAACLQMSAKNNKIVQQKMERQLLEEVEGESLKLRSSLKKVEERVVTNFNQKIIKDMNQRKTKSMLLLGVCLVSFITLWIVCGPNWQGESSNKVITESDRLFQKNSLNERPSEINNFHQRKNLNETKTSETLEVCEVERSFFSRVNNFKEQSQPTVIEEKMEVDSVQVSMTPPSEVQTSKIWVCVAAVIFIVILGVCFKPLRQKITFERTKMAYIEEMKENPNNQAAHYNMGLSYCNNEMFIEAIGYFKKAHSINSKDISTMSKLQLCYFKLGGYKKSIEWNQKIIEINPKNETAYNNIGAALGRLGRYNEAIEKNKIALNINPHYVTVLYNMGIIYTKGQKYEEAINYLQQALEIDPTHKLAQNQLKLIFQKLKRL